MHGRSKNEYKEPTEAEKEYLRKTKDLFEECSEKIKNDRKNNSCSFSTFKMTEKILKINPEIPTFWNYRKKFIESLIDKDTDMMIDIVNSEFTFTENLFKTDPKSYSLWSNRVWLIELVLNTNSIKIKSELENRDVGPVDIFELENGYLKVINNFDNFSFSSEFKKYLLEHITVYLKLLANELELCKKLLNFDDRNFHCWKHRSFILTCLRYLSVKYSWKDFQKNLHIEEFKFLNKLIENNFSNYSAWHQRILLSGNNHLFNTLDDFDREVKLAHTAIFTEPNDQSVWQYYSWLIEKLLPKIMFKDNNFYVCPRFFIKTVKLSSHSENDIKLNDKIGTHSISIQLSNSCLISSKYSNVTLILNNNEVLPIKNGNWIPIYQDYEDGINDENSFKFNNKRLPSNFRSTIKKNSNNWKFVFDFVENNLNKSDSTLRNLFEENSVQIFMNLFSTNSGTTISNKPLWSLESELYRKDYFSSKTFSPKINFIDQKKYQFVIQKEEHNNISMLKCRYHYYSDNDINSGSMSIDSAILSNLNEWKSILLNEFNILKEIQELEPHCKYPILALNKLYDIFNLCIPYGLSQENEISFNTKLIDSLHIIDPLRKGYYNQKF
ncbi:Rab geranylgeranyltransferase [Cryptosporidium bovis]|uniref:Rab geranylgeranyltransferase n=1 Tax=Cryptosporidium bovis TaxID=310047 RepID=UPI00351A4F3E|nr:Rab geranylgeranyltransferase [Cryptosporidium bovis]